MFIFLFSRRKIYVGDLSSSDFATPRKRKRNVTNVKTIMDDQRRKIHSLQMKVRRLKYRVTSLTALLNILKEKSYITETSEPAIRVSIILEMLLFLGHGYINNNYNIIDIKFNFALEMHSNFFLQNSAIPISFC